MTECYVVKMRAISTHAYFGVSSKASIASWGWGPFCFFKRIDGNVSAVLTSSFIGAVSRRLSFSVHIRVIVEISAILALCAHFAWFFFGAFASYALRSTSGLAIGFFPNPLRIWEIVLLVSSSWFSFCGVQKDCVTLEGVRWTLFTKATLTWARASEFETMTQSDAQ